MDFKHPSKLLTKNSYSLLLTPSNFQFDWYYFNHAYMLHYKNNIRKYDHNSHFTDKETETQS